MNDVTIYRPSDYRMDAARELLQKALETWKQGDVPDPLHVEASLCLLLERRGAHWIADRLSWLSQQTILFREWVSSPPDLSVEIVYKGSLLYFRPDDVVELLF